MIDERARGVIRRNGESGSERRKILFREMIYFLSFCPSLILVFYPIANSEEAAKCKQIIYPRKSKALSFRRVRYN